MLNSIEKILLTEEQIKERVKQLGEEITNFYGNETVYAITILKGAAPFAMELVKSIKLDVRFDFMAVSSYGSGTVSSGTLKIKKDCDIDVAGKNILVIEDIIDSGITMKNVSELMKERGAKSFKVVSLLSKPSRRIVDYEPDFLGFEVPDEFVVGYGLDYDEKFRGLPYIGVLKREVYEK